MTEHTGFESRLIKHIASGATEPYVETLARIIDKNIEELRALEFPVNGENIPADTTLADFIGRRWPSDAGPVPAPWQRVCLSVALLGIIDVMKQDMAQGWPLMESLRKAKI